MPWLGQPCRFTMPDLNSGTSTRLCAGDGSPRGQRERGAQHGVPGLVHLFGIESPGLTSSLSLGEEVAGYLES